MMSTWLILIIAINTAMLFVAFPKICSNLMTRKGITVKFNCNQIWIIREKENISTMGPSTKTQLNVVEWELHMHIYLSCYLQSPMQCGNKHHGTGHSAWSYFEMNSLSNFGFLQNMTYNLHCNIEKDVSVLVRVFSLKLFLNEFFV